VGAGLKAGEKELEARVEAAEHAAAEMRAREAGAAAEEESAGAEQKALEQELYDLDAAAEREGLMCAYPPPRRSTRVSAGIRNQRSSFTIKRKKKVMPSLFKLIKQRTEYRWVMIGE